MFVSSIRRAWSQPKRLRRLAPYTLACAAILCIVHASVAGLNTTHSESIGYLCLTLTLLGCSCAFWVRGREQAGSLRARWLLMSLGALAGALDYAPSFIELYWQVPPARVFQVISANVSEALFLLAGVLFFAGVARFIVLVDLLQGLLFAILRFDLAYSRNTPDHFATNHLLVGQLIALVLLLIAGLACLGAASRAEFRFLRVLVWFFGIRVVGFFLSNQVSYTWLHYQNSSLWDVPDMALLAVFALALVHGAREEAGAARLEQRNPSVMVRSLMPSVLALVNLLLGLMVLQLSVRLASIAIALSVIFYVARMVLLHAQAVRENAYLQSRNEQLEGLARRDPLTGLGNRRSLAAAYHESQSLHGGHGLALMLLDIDYFKQANDRHGHLHGDEILVALARNLEKIAEGTVRSHCARFGGDEFAVLLPGVSSAQAWGLAQELRSEFKKAGFRAEHGIVSLSVGIAALHAAQDLPLERLILRADQALYRAKMLGRNRVEVQPVWESLMDQQSAAEGSQLLNVN